MAINFEDVSTESLEDVKRELNLIKHRISFLEKDIEKYSKKTDIQDKPSKNVDTTEDTAFATLDKTDAAEDSSFWLGWLVVVLIIFVIIIFVIAICEN